MGPNWKLFLLLTIALTTCIHEGLGIKCFECSSKFDPECADPFDNSTVPLTDCKQQPTPVHFPGVKSTMCYKTRQQVNGEWIYFRGCARMQELRIAEDARPCLTTTSTNNTLTEYCTCNSTEACNTGPLVHSNQLAVLLAVSVTYFVTCFHTKKA